jgi:serine/threonine protein kinase
MWSLGCIFGEMLGGKPVFAGSSTLNQFEKIVEVLGMPKDEAVEDLKSVFIKTMLESLTNSNDAVKTSEGHKLAWKTMYPTASEDAIDLLTCLIQFSPSERMTARDGLTHPYCSQFHDEETEIVASEVVNVKVDGDGGGGDVHVWDNTKHSTAFYRDSLYRMINKNSKSKK